MSKISVGNINQIVKNTKEETVKWDVKCKDKTYVIEFKKRTLSNNWKLTSPRNFQPVERSNFGKYFFTDFPKYLQLLHKNNKQK